MDNFDVIVIGAGPGGVTVASLLANSGKKVLLVDKNQKAGGRMMTINKDKLSSALGKQHDVKLILGDDFGIGKMR